MATIRELVNAKKFFAENPEATARLNPSRIVNAQQYRRWFMDCLNAKINRNQKPAGKKDSPQWFFEVLRIARRLQDREIVRDYELNFAPMIKARVMHRLYTADDF